MGLTSFFSNSNLGLSPGNMLFVLVFIWLYMAKDFFRSISSVSSINLGGMLPLRLCVGTNVLVPSGFDSLFVEFSLFLCSGVRVPFPNFLCCSWNVSSWVSSFSNTPVITGLLESDDLSMKSFMKPFRSMHSSLFGVVPFTWRFGFDLTVSVELLASVESCCSIDEPESCDDSTLCCFSSKSSCNRKCHSITYDLRRKKNGKRFMKHDV